MSEFRLCEKAKLIPVEIDGVRWVPAATVEQFLENAITVYARVHEDREAYWSRTQSNFDKEFDTHTAKLVMIEQVAKDSAESLLLEFVNYEAGDADWMTRWNNLKSRAKRLLGHD